MKTPLKLNSTLNWLMEKDRDNTKIAKRSHEMYARIDESKQEAKMHGVPTTMYFEGVLTDGGGANEFISATSRGRGRN